MYFLNDSIHTDIDIIKFNTNETFEYSIKTQEELFSIFSDNSKTKLKSIEDVRSLPRRHSSIFFAHKSYFSYVNNLKTNISNLFTDGLYKFKKLEDELLRYLKSTPFEKKINSYKSFINIINKVCLFDFTQSDLIKIKNLIAEKEKIGILYLLINNNEIDINMLC